MAFIVKEEGKEVSEEDLKGYVKAGPGALQGSARIVFVEELPRNATGKVLKRELAEQQHAD